MGYVENCVLCDFGDFHLSVQLFRGCRVHIESAMLARLKNHRIHRTARDYLIADAISNAELILKTIDQRWPDSMAVDER